MTEVSPAAKVLVEAEKQELMDSDDVDRTRDLNDRLAMAERALMSR